MVWTPLTFCSVFKNTNLETPKNWALSKFWNVSLVHPKSVRELLTRRRFSGLSELTQLSLLLLFCAGMPRQHPGPDMPNFYSLSPGGVGQITPPLGWWVTDRGKKKEKKRKLFLTHSHAKLILVNKERWRCSLFAWLAQCIQPHQSRFPASTSSTSRHTWDHMDLQSHHKTAWKHFSFWVILFFFI